MNYAPVQNGSDNDSSDETKDHTRRHRAANSVTRRNSPATGSSRVRFAGGSHQRSIIAESESESEAVILSNKASNMLAKDKMYCALKKFQGIVEHQGYTTPRVRATRSRYTPTRVSSVIVSTDGGNSTDEDFRNIRRLDTSSNAENHLGLLVIAATMEAREK